MKRNKGAAGVDGLDLEHAASLIRSEWDKIKTLLLAGRYRPAPVRRVEIPKPNGGVRRLGVPTILDRFLQQAALQVLGLLFEPHFPEHSYGFRPGRSAHQVVLAAREYQRAGKRWVVDIDLASFFDEVNHDLLMANRVFLGYSFTIHRQTKNRVPAKTCQKMRAKVKERFRQARGQNVARFIREPLNPLLRGWMNYFRLSETRGGVGAAARGSTVAPPTCMPPSLRRRLPPWASLT